jgi:hypothetical protein
MKLLIMQFLQPLVTSSLFGPNILLSTLFSNTLSLCPSLDVRDEVSRPYRTAGKILLADEVQKTFAREQRSLLPYRGYTYVCVYVFI